MVSFSFQIEFLADLFCFTTIGTGCGVPAGPFGIYGAVEGISYLSIVAIAGFATFKKVKTVSFLPMPSERQM